MTVDHKISDCRNGAMLIPFGLYKNSFLHEMKPGNVLYTMDDPPREIVILAITTLSARGETAQALSLLLYNQPIEPVLEAMRRNWKREINGNEIFLLIYKAL